MVPHLGGDGPSRMVYTPLPFWLKMIRRKTNINKLVLTLMVAELGQIYWLS